MGTINCVYETPCGWCSKWDKKCDRKIPERGQRARCNPVDDAINKVEKEYIKEVLANKMCVEESDHEWECCGISTVGTDYICKKCGTHKVYSYDYNDNISVTI